MNSLEVTSKSKKIKKGVAIGVLCLCVFLFLFSTFNLLMPIKTFFLGTFGIMFYCMLVFAMLFCIGVISGLKFVYSPKYLVFLGLCFFFLFCVLHIVFTGFGKTADLSYGQYLVACYGAMWTPGGLFIGLFCFPIISFLHDVAGIVFYAIAFVISLYFVLSYLDSVRQGKIQATLKIQNKYENFGSVMPQSEYAEQNFEQNNLEQRVVEEQTNVANDQVQEDDSIFINDEELNLAKEKLGLVKREQEEEQKRTSSSKLFVEDDEEEDTWQSRAREVEQKPRKFVENSQTTKQSNPLFEKNKEYLKTLYQVNTDSSNPIINAEDYEDYKQKIKDYNERNSQPFKRELNVNQTLNPSNYQKNNIEDNYEQEVEENQNEDFSIEPDGEISEIEDFITPTNRVENNFELPRIDINQSNFDLQDEVEQDSTKKFMDSGDFNKSANIDLNKFNDSNIDSVMGKKIELNQNPSNVYNLPNNFKASDYKQLEIMGTQKEKKSSVPQFVYDSKYVRPPINLLQDYINEEDLATDHNKNIEILERVLDEFKIPAKVEAVRRGAAVTRYELHMPVGIPVRKIHQHASDIALALAAPGEIRIETPIKGKSAVGIEVPNKVIDKVGFKEIVASNEFQNAKKPLTFALGKDIDGTIHCCDLASMPHLLVAGSTGSGKSVCLNTLILSFIYRTSPEDLRLILVDPKRVEFAIFNGLPHLLMPKAITEPKKALNAFDWLINEMERRFMVFQECYVKNIGEYNAQPEVVSKKFPKMPYIVLIVDELADLVVTTNKKELEDKIIRLTQKARAAGIHVILATQRPSVDIITGSIKINLPSRIAFAVTSFVDSKTILDQAGAEKLLGRGDMLYSPQSSEPMRIQGAFVDTPEVRSVVEFVKRNNPSTYDDNISKIINSESGPVGGASVGASGGEEFDSLMPDALKLVIENGQASISMLQRRFSIGFSRAARIIDQMEVAKFISTSDGSKPRTVYITMEDYEKLYGNN